MPRRSRLLSRSSLTPRRCAGWHAFSHVSRLLLAAGLAVSMSGCSGHAAKGPALHRVVIRAFKFEPDSLVIAAGDTVEWLNQDLVPHTSTAASGRWNSTSIQPNGSWRTVLSTPGNEPYACQLHPTMRARIDVR